MFAVVTPDTIYLPPYWHGKLYTSIFNVGSAGTYGKKSIRFCDVYDGLRLRSYEKSREKMRSHPQELSTLKLL
ncbi:MAG: hypothetical protein RMZ41_027140 [Nostoc sp. DedVER02]|uniref:hypothetical protein n=1 Tax=unclassified Nostoc TaxID=2593658 RepID=UPI002AD50A02|nr:MULTISPECIES: hypothetical protein [unclassified Nostoc]MDZ7988332.1 hypothetical protein [Nostoc sp. DedVER02]MDZ8115492.1 hypothetical protein [Nostoc sp. DedVER01b]